MSELQKKLLKRIQEKEVSVNFQPHACDGDIVESKEDSFNGLSDSRLNSTNFDDSTLQSNCEESKRETFDSEAVYINEETGMLFQTYYIKPKKENTSLVVCLHGAGSSSMTFFMFAKYLTKGEDAPGVLLYDLRGHGHSSDPERADFSIEALTSDFLFVLEEFHKREQKVFDLYLVGHSLGGCIAANYILEFPNDKSVKGLIMFDIVEETAIRSLKVMPQFINSRPDRFPDLRTAIFWHLRKNILYSYESAAHSIPDILRRRSNSFIWRTNLLDTEPYWKGWFKGLSNNFVSCGDSRHVAKLLLLSGHESLDKDLIIGQMQGKYQLIVFNNDNKVGHFIQEDVPEKVSVTILDFIQRNSGPSQYTVSGKKLTPRWGGQINL